jgi:large subunit ribosomal protein L10
MPTQPKTQEVECLKEKFERAVSLVLADYRGLTANEMVELRERFTKEGLEYRVVKDTLARIAVAETGIDGLAELFAGPIAVALGYDDPAVPFRLSEECRKKYAPHYELRGGLFEGALVLEAEVKRYAFLPSREELLAKLAMLLSSPMKALAVMLQAKIRELAIVLSEVAKNREQEPQEEPIPEAEQTSAEPPVPEEQPADQPEQEEPEDQQEPQEELAQEEQEPQEQ